MNNRNTRRNRNIADCSKAPESATPFLYIPTEKDQTPVASAAYYGNYSELARLLADGASPNASCNAVISPIEAAILGGKPLSVEIILAHPLFDPTPSEGVLDAFAHGADSPAIAVCCELAAPKILGCEFSPFDNTPLPSALTLPHIVNASSWGLLIRFLKFNDANTREQRRIANGMIWEQLITTPQLGIPVLATILKSCPDLMHHRAVQQCFCALALSNPICIPRQLQPFIRLLPKEISLSHSPILRWSGPDGLLCRWHSHLIGIVPCLALSKGLPDTSPSEEMVDHLLRTCRITGHACKRQDSPLLRDILMYASDDTLQRQLQPGGALAALPKTLLENATTATQHCEERCRHWKTLLSEI